MKNNIPHCVLLSFLLMSTSCSLNSHPDSTSSNQILQIRLPNAEQSQMMARDFAPRVHSRFSAGNASVPQAFADFNCFAVNITGLGIDPAANLSCSDKNLYFGINAGFFTAGAQTVALSVPNGPARRIQIIGAESTIGCPALSELLLQAQSSGAQSAAFLGISNLYVLGEATVDVFQDTSVSISAQFDAANPTLAFEGCGSGPAPPSGLGYLNSPLVLALNLPMTAQTLSNAGGVITSCASVPSLPAGISLSSGCVLSGTPTVAQAATNYVITATNSVGSASAAMSISISASVSYTTTYDGNGNTGGSVPTDASSPYSTGSTVTVSSNTGTLVKSGSVFSGWNTIADGSGTFYDNSGTQTFAMGASNVTLYAQWSLNTYTVGGTISGLNGTVVLQNNGANNLSLSANGALTFTAGLVATATYAVTVFTQPTDQVCTVTSGGAGTMGTTNVTTVAVACLTNTYTVSYDGNGNTGGAVPASPTGYAHNAAVTVAANSGAFVKSGYTFSGWNTVANGSGTTYAGSGTATLTMGTSNVTLYAQWSIGGSPTAPSGVLQSFSALVATLPGTLDSAAAVQVGSILYLIGGNYNTSATSGILQTTIALDGSISAVALSNYSLNVARYGARAEVIGNYLYVFGGMDGTGTLLNSIECAPIGSSGITGVFTVAAQTMATARYYFLTLVTSGYVYAMGGNYPELNTIERAPLDPATGMITGSFTAMSRSVVDTNNVLNGLNDARWTLGGIRLGDNFYIMGGEGQNTIEMVAIQSDGTLGTFTRAGTLPSARNRLSVIALSGTAYVFGGWNGTYLSTVETAAITGNTLGVFSTSSVTLSVPVQDGAALLTSSAVFLFGGDNPASYNTIQQALINPL